MKKPRKIAGKGKSIDLHYMGSEPVLDTVSDRKDHSYIKALNWYNYTHDISTGKKWIFEYIKTSSTFADAERVEYATKLKKCPDWSIPLTACWIARMSNNETKLCPDIHDYIKYLINNTIDKYATPSIDPVVKAKAKPKVDIQARTLDKHNAIFSMVEELFDNDESIYDFLVKNEHTGMAATFIAEQYKIDLGEIKQEIRLKAKCKKEGKVFESYFGSDSRVKALKAKLESVISDCERYASNKKATKVRKPRIKTPKMISANKLVEKLKYKTDLPDLKLKSVNPENIIGASIVWVYNTKTRKLGVYNTTMGATLSVKGASIINFDEKTSVAKTLRKPDEIISSLLKKRSPRPNFMKDIKAVESALTGRMGTDIMILKVVK